MSTKQRPASRREPASWWDRLTSVSRPFDQDFDSRNRANGFDLLSYGPWQQRYGRWIVGALGLKNQRVFDVGYGCGSVLRSFVEAGADAEGMDCNEELVLLGRWRWPDIAARLWVGYLENMYMMPDLMYDWMHSRVVAEYWMPDLVPQILGELCRIMNPGGIFYCACGSDIPKTPNADRPEKAVWSYRMPATWWERQFRHAGWEVVSKEWEQRLRNHPESLMREHDWPWLVARKKVLPGQTGRHSWQTQTTKHPDSAEVGRVKDQEASKPIV